MNNAYKGNLATGQKVVLEAMRKYAITDAMHYELEGTFYHGDKDGYVTFEIGNAVKLTIPLNTICSLKKL